MDLKDKIKKTNGASGTNAPFRQSGADRSAYIPAPQRQRNTNRQTPRSVQYQPETDYEVNAQQENVPPMQQQGGIVPNQYGTNQYSQFDNNTSNYPQQETPMPQSGNAFIPMQESFTPQQGMGFPPQQEDANNPFGFAQPAPNPFEVTDREDDANIMDLNAFFGSKQDDEPAVHAQASSQPMLGGMPANASVPTENFFPQEQMPVNAPMTSSTPVAEPHQFAEFPQQTPISETCQPVPATNVQAPPAKDVAKIRNDFIGLISDLFARYDIEKILIVAGKIYTVKFVDEEDEEIFEETINTDIIDRYATEFASLGHAELSLDDGIRVEMTCAPVSPDTTIVATKLEFDLYIDEEFVSILYEFLTKKKNVVLLSSFALDTMYKVTSDFYRNNLCLTINEPIKTTNSISFFENPTKPSLKTVYSIAGKISPDNVLVYNPNDMFFTIAYMKRHTGVVMFSETDNATDFINADVINALGGMREYNRLSILKAIDIIFTITKTKDGKTKYIATQLLSATNKSHINKIKRIVGDNEIDANKIYFYNLFEKEV